MAAASSNCSHAPPSDGAFSEVSGGKGFMLFGVRVVTEGSFRKSASTNNLAQFDQIQDSNSDFVAAGYASDDVVHPSGRNGHRKRGVAWSEDEHKLFLLGLQTVGKGDWRGISRNFVKTRTPTQVASHAQKYFLRRRNNQNRRRRRSSLFDITTDAVQSSAIEDQMHLENLPTPILQHPNLSKNIEKCPIISPFALPITPISKENSMENLTHLQINQLNNSPRPIRPIPILPIPSLKMANLDLNRTTTLEPPSLSLNLSTPSQPSDPPLNHQSPPHNQQLPPSRHTSAFQTVPSNFNGGGGDNIIRVA